MKIFNQFYVGQLHSVKNGQNMIHLQNITKSEFTYKFNLSILFYFLLFYNSIYNDPYFPGMIEGANVTPTCHLCCVDRIELLLVVEQAEYFRAYVLFFAKKQQL